jgi:hypothetical protein
MQFTGPQARNVSPKRALCLAPLKSGHAPVVGSADGAKRLVGLYQTVDKVFYYALRVEGVI